MFYNKYSMIIRPLWSWKGQTRLSRMQGRAGEARYGGARTFLFGPSSSVAREVGACYKGSVVALLLELPSIGSGRDESYRDLYPIVPGR